MDERKVELKQITVNAISVMMTPCLNATGLENASISLINTT